MPNFVKIGQTADIPDGEGRTFEIEGQQVAIFNVGGQFHAVEGSCPHRGGPLGEGYLEHNVVSCPWLGWRFDVTTGVSPVNPEATVSCYPVKVEGADLLVGL
ncbi:MAG: Rieske (2Fe-2S) protein [Candidatus Omnitrophica bacterium]|nr:Rieske (2Fe-2S) protein [Candidatus Omnitrophota bacterium]